MEAAQVLVFPCAHCTHTFPTALLAVHHEEEHIFRCVYCIKKPVFNSLATLVSHQSNHKHLSYVCRTGNCRLKFDSAASLATHKCYR